MSATHPYMVPLCRFCGIPVVWGSFVIGMWTHTDGLTFCPDETDPFSPIAPQATPTIFSMMPS